MPAPVRTTTFTAARSHPAAVALHRLRRAESRSALAAQEVDAVGAVERVPGVEEAVEVAQPEERQAGDPTQHDRPGECPEEVADRPAQRGPGAGHLPALQLLELAEQVAVAG